ncbi:MAG: Zonular occludens toxin, partial [Bacteroidetes bacterium]|nr:Zonular occludens toxin [Bacteroidota bacterium]
MAIIAYTGVMGSGKTYEAVSTAALGALKAGRRVVTNISGFNFEAIRDYLGPFNDGAYLEPNRIVVVPSARVTEPHFFYDPEIPADSVVKPGDLVLIDEAWLFWANGTKIPEEHQKFFRMHRHYVEQNTGQSCDVCIMIQDINGLHRDIRGVLETNYKFTKLKSLGIASRYRIEVYEGGTRQKETFISASLKKYDKAIFPLYQSYEGQAGREGTIDKRQNIFNNKWLMSVLVISTVLAVTSI